MKFGYFVQYTSPLKRHYWYCLISPSGLASASRRSYKMESWGCGIHSSVAFNMSVHQHTTMGKNQHCCSNPNMNFEYFVQYASPLKTHYLHFLIPPSGLASGSRKCCKMNSRGHGIHSFETFNMSLHQLPTMGKTQHCCSNPNRWMSSNVGKNRFGPFQELEVVFNIF